VAEKLLVLTLKTDAIFTQHSATIGVPESHDAPPGGALLGAVAAALYNGEHDQATAFRAVQLGTLRISDGLPLGPDGLVALPAPLTWHTVKGEDSALIADLSTARRMPGKQYSQKRGGWVVVGGNGVRTVRVKRRSSMRTAIEEGGRAREGLLYGFEAVPAGQRYLVRVWSDDPKVLATAVTKLCERMVRLGRSRTAEFGEATLEAATEGLTWPTSGAQAGRLVRMLCVSDLALRDPQSGQPTLRPTASLLGLPSGFTLDIERSAIRTRRYSPWNGHRQRPDLERQVIIAGSVLVWSTDGAVLEESQIQQLALGVGEHTAAGLGQLLVEPPGLFGANVRVDTREEDPAGASPANDASPPKDDDLWAWMEARHRALAKADRTWAVANDYAKVASTWGVSRSQWGRLRALAAGWVHKEDTTDTRKELLSQIRALLVEGVTLDAWRAHAAQLAGGLKVERVERTTEVSVPQLGGKGNPNVQKDGASVIRRDNASNEQRRTWSDDGELNRWLARAGDEDIHFARAVAILARRAVRTHGAPAPSSTEESK
jgi:CRISPR-associated protein Csx10